MTQKLPYLALLCIALLAACKKDNGNPTRYLESVVFTADTVSVTIGQQSQLHIKLNPTNAADAQMAFSSADTSVAIVNSGGLVTAKNVGTVTITTTNTKKTVSAHCVVKVTPVGVTTLSLDSAALTIEVGYADTLMASISPSDATFKTLTWTSSNTAVATVNSNGKVTALTEGAANITATTTDGKSATCKVQVKTLEEMLYPATSTAYGLVATDSEDVYFYLTNTTKSDITLTEADVFNTNNSVVPFQKDTYQSSLFVIHPGQAFTTVFATGDISLQEGVNNGVVVWPANVYFTTNGKNYEMQLQVNITSFTAL
jgi:hypothetical protein